MPNFNDDIFLGNSQTYMGTGPYAASSVISATIAGTVLTVVQALSGDPVIVGSWLTGSGVTANTYIVASLGLNNLGQPTYQLNISQTVASATTMYVAGNAILGDPAPMSLGMGPMGRTFHWDCIPQALQLANIAASQTPAGAGNLTLTAGTSVSSVVKSNGLTVIQLDVPRAVSITQVAAGANVNFTISGYDFYGQAMTQLITSSTGATVTTLKAFYQISQVAVAGATTTAVTVGTSDVLGIPIRIIDGAYVDNFGYNNSIVDDNGTFVAAVTATATSSTGDVRGTYKPSSATSGSKRLVGAFFVPAIGSGPNSTRIGALGVTQA